MEKIEFELREGSEYIDLMQLLKAEQIAQTGGHAKMIIEDELVSVNGEVELRKRRKLRKGDIVEVDQFKIQIV